MVQGKSVYGIADGSEVFSKIRAFYVAFGINDDYEIAFAGNHKVAVAESNGEAVGSNSAGQSVRKHVEEAFEVIVEEARFEGNRLSCLCKLVFSAGYVIVIFVGEHSIDNTVIELEVYALARFETLCYAYEVALHALINIIVLRCAGRQGLEELQKYYALVVCRCAQHTVGRGHILSKRNRSQILAVFVVNFKSHRRIVLYEKFSELFSGRGFLNDSGIDYFY